MGSDFYSAQSLHIADSQVQQPKVWTHLKNNPNSQSCLAIIAFGKATKMTFRIEFSCETVCQFLGQITLLGTPIPSQPLTRLFKGKLKLYWDATYTGQENTGNATVSSIYFKIDSYIAIIVLTLVT